VKHLAGLFLLAVLVACASPTAPTPPPADPNLLVTPVEHQGPVAIDFVSASIAPGSTITGCGNYIVGCRSMLSMLLRLMPSQNGPVLWVRTYLFGTNNLACLYGEVTGMTLFAGVPATVDVLLDTADPCGVPNDMVAMVALVGGPVQIESRQGWTIHYHFAP
jgi:hypothetical protein